MIDLLSLLFKNTKGPAYKVATFIKGVIGIVINFILCYTFVDMVKWSPPFWLQCLNCSLVLWFAGGVIFYLCEMQRVLYDD